MRYISDIRIFDAFCLRCRFHHFPFTLLLSLSHCVRRAQSLFDRNDLFILIYWFYSHSLFLMDSIRIHQRISSIVYRLSRLPHRIRNSMCWQNIVGSASIWNRMLRLWLVLSVYAARSKRDRRPPHPTPYRYGQCDKLKANAYHRPNEGTKNEPHTRTHTIAVSVFNRPFDFWPPRFVVVGDYIVGCLRQGM